MPLDKKQIARQFVDRFGQSPQWIIRAPGRVNLIGEHTDYNDGFVLPLAIDRAVWIAARPRADRSVVVRSIDYAEEASFSLDVPVKGGPGWIEYVKGVAWSLQEAGHELCGWEGVMSGDVPREAGLSSSAALEIATARAFAALGGIAWDPIAMARLAQRAENRWIGVNCGIMDQLISAAGREDHALLIDCRTLEIQPVPFPPGIAVVVLDTATRRGLVDSAYNQRRDQCKSAAEFFRVPALRDVDLELFQRVAADMDETIRRRAMHVITENDRTLQAVEAMRRGDSAALGMLMNKSHASLRDDYEVSSEALNIIVQSALNQVSCYGARMTGAGFGGCAVAVVDRESTDGFARAVAADYQAQTGHTPAIYVCHPSNGAEAISHGWHVPEERRAC